VRPVPTNGHCSHFGQPGCGGLTQAEVAEAMGVSQQRVSAIESGGVAELATLADYIRALGGELKVIADFGDSWRRVA
jgi:transcriptional regulator with XRE-family HTH domain